ncbi:MAG: hypothetical protein KDA63_20245 [Planctomycetales bacterium]|nr:hypothetical protein [Planctomycetales bacterium]
MLELARDRFGMGPNRTLRSADERLFKAVAAGEVADYTVGDTIADDPANAGNWRDERAIPGDRIEWLCLDARARALITPRGIEAIGVGIIDDVNLRHVDCSWTLSLVRCGFFGSLEFDGATFRALKLSGSHSYTTNRFAVSMDRGEVKGTLFLDEGFRAQSEINLLGIVVGGDVTFDGSEIHHPGKDAISLDGASLRGSLSFCHGFRAYGTVRLLGAIVHGNLACRGGEFNGLGDHLSDPCDENCALGTDGSCVHGDVFLDHGFKAAGKVRMVGMKVNGQLNCRGANIYNPDDDALLLDNVDVGETLFLDGEMDAAGTVRFCGSSIRGGVSIEIASKVELNARNAHIEDTVILVVRNPICADWRHANVLGLFDVLFHTDASYVLDMRHAAVTTLQFGDLVTNVRAHNGAGHRCIRLSGLQYDTLVLTNTQSDSSGRKYESWLRLQYSDALLSNDFDPQPYDQLASALNREGREREATSVLVAKNNDRLKYADMTLTSRCCDIFTGWLIGYGHRPKQAGYSAILIVVFGWLIFYLGWQSSLITPLDGTKEMPKAGGAFSSFVYSIDCFVPIVDFN